MNRDEQTYYCLGQCLGFLKMIKYMKLDKIKEHAEKLLKDIEIMREVRMCRNDRYINKKR